MGAESDQITHAIDRLTKAVEDVGESIHGLIEAVGPGGVVDKLCVIVEAINGLERCVGDTVCGEAGLMDSLAEVKASIDAGAKRIGDCIDDLDP